MVSAAFFDIFGILAFIIIIFVGWMIIKKEKFPNWLGYIVLGIGLLGLLIDSYIVIKTYLIGG